jgi:membrane protease YdiL (CAAX protease family)
MNTAGWVAALLLPLIYQGVPNPIALRWLLAHGSAPMPDGELKRATTISKAMPYTHLLALTGALGILLWQMDESPRWLDPPRNWLTMGGMGVIAGFAWLMLVATILKVSSPTRHRHADHPFAQHSTGYWVPLIVGASIVEESWRAFCVWALGAASQGTAILVSSAAFGIAHANPPTRIIPALLFALYAGLLFLWTESLVVTILVHAIVNLGVFCFVRIRRKA